MAGLQDGNGTRLVDQIKYTLGSKWAPVGIGEQTFEAFTDMAGNNSTTKAARRRLRARVAKLADATFTPPAAPNVFTTFLMGSKSFGYSLLPAVDAPETGPCKPP
eukprot:COSAG01_NODE_5018_length_4541_cov_2.682575_4_plen_105_part_00